MTEADAGSGISVAVMTPSAPAAVTDAPPTAMQLASLVAMRLTHDLAGPIGAMATAVELLDGGDPEITALIADGAAAAVASLRLHRFILAPPGDAAPARQLLTAWVATREKVTLDWRADPDDAKKAAILLGLAMTAVEAARRGGTLTVDRGVSFAPAPALDASIAGALAGEPVTVARAALAGLLYAAAAARGGVISVMAGSDALQLTVGYAATRLA